MVGPRLILQRFQTLEMAEKNLRRHRSGRPVLSDCLRKARGRSVYEDHQIATETSQC